MKNLFERTSSNWVRYSEYEWRAAEDGTLYLTPTKTAQPGIYDPLAEYGLLGLMTALPTTPTFMDYEAVYLSKNHFIKEETMSTKDYLHLSVLSISQSGCGQAWCRIHVEHTE